ncbi:MAG: type 2 isopentenyl-diphosphate Delta-isomerase [Candidatus Terraquivivens tikiterensis]|uniref:Isopentenyl-diphosphate delta-isomerase n=1 Tax=Candidatus Terraquivivens tikiterensis TaxID=1980982 RepID=A0A2R7Y355_9ARCH|nr:MAG: type 2 isopentenyl-diphosphate Delta-isomerase [Candidatus Terraquivivens tikiterensis]
MSENGIEFRKLDHIRICLEKDVEFKQKTTWLEFVELVHLAAPELDYSEVDTSAEFLGRRFSAPILIEGMTGGAKGSEAINRNLAMAASELNIPMGLGSQRAAVEKPELAESFKVVREVAPDVFLIANIGGVQLVEGGPSLAEEVVSMVDANALAVHLNPLHEIVQPHGTTSFKGMLDVIRKVVERLSVPLIVKEIGCGISGSLSRRLEEIGVAAVDVGGAGGTNWTLIERIRALERGFLENAAIGKTFMEWGIPTAAATIEAYASTRIPVISSGGIRSGLDVAKSIAIGASMAGIARPLLQQAVVGPDRVLMVLRQFISELKTAMFLTGCRDVDSLKRAEVVVTGRLLEWVKQRGIRHPKIKCV